MLPTISSRALRGKEHLRGFLSDSVLATNLCIKVRTRSFHTFETLWDIAWSSPTLLAVAKETRNRVFIVRSHRLADDSGSNGGSRRRVSTLSKS